MRRLVGILLQPRDLAQIWAKVFDGKVGFEIAHAVVRRQAICPRIVEPTGRIREFSIT